MADSNNQPAWREHPEISGSMERPNGYGDAGNGRGVQQNELPKGARRVPESEKTNDPQIIREALDGNGYGNYDPRYTRETALEKKQFLMGEQTDGTQLSSQDGDHQDRVNPVLENPTADITRSNPLNNDSFAGAHGNPYRDGMKKEWSS